MVIEEGDMKMVAGIVVAMGLLSACGLQAREPDMPPSSEEQLGEQPPELLAFLDELAELSRIEGYLRARWKHLAAEWPEVEQHLNQMLAEGQLDALEQATDEELDKIGHLADRWYQMLLQADLWWQKYDALEQQWEQEKFKWLDEWKQLRPAWEQGRKELLTQWRELEHWRHRLLLLKRMLKREKT